jgi:hypothetical protein
MADGLPAPALRAGAESGRGRLVEPEEIAGNLTKQGIDQLAALVKTRLTWMQYRPGLIDGFLAKTGLDLTS